MPSPTPFWPQTLVDYAQILAAIATSAAVIVTLWIATRRPMPLLRTHCEIYMIVGQTMKEPYPEFLQIQAVNIGPLEATISGVGWLLKKRWWQRKKDALWAIQDLTFHHDLMANPNMPTLIKHGEEAKYSIPLQGNVNWLRNIEERGFFKERVKTRKSLERLRTVVFVTVGKNFYGKPSKQALDRIWEAQEKHVAAQAAA